MYLKVDFFKKKIGEHERDALGVAVACNEVSGEVASLLFQVGQGVDYRLNLHSLAS